jgi:hypothetical protein
VPAFFALDQNFPQPIVDGLSDYLEADADLTPIADIHEGMVTLDDWQVLLALHTDARSWDGLITTDARMLNLPRELAVLCQTKLTLVVAVEAGHDPIKATGLVLAHLSNVCRRTRARPGAGMAAKDPGARGTGPVDTPRPRGAPTRRNRERRIRPRGSQQDRPESVAARWA